MLNTDKPVAYIINESLEDAISFDIVDENKTTGFVTAEGIIQQAGKMNRNRRYYTQEDLHKEIYSDRIRELVTTGNFKGEAGHPLDMNLSRQQKVDPTLEQVWYTKVWMDGDYVKAHFRGTNNELGKAFNEDLKCGQKPSFSLRSLGSIRIVNGKSNVTNLRIITYDRVYYPSYDNAYTERIVSESTDYKTPSYPYEEYLNSMGNKQVIEESTDSIAPILNKDVTDLLLRESYSFNQICEDFSPIYKSIKLSDDKKKVIMVDESYNTIIVPIDRYVTNKIDEFCSRL
jgi:hypothetical protein|nr:MAG TPA: Prohead core protein serine protease [Caudoviricetes sp.]